MKRFKTFILYVCGKLLGKPNINQNYSTKTDCGMDITTDISTEILCDLKNVTVLNNKRQIKCINFNYRKEFYPFEYCHNKIENEPTIILYDEPAAFISHVSIPIPCNKYVAGGRFNVFDPFYATDVISHFWISDLGYVVIGTKTIKLDNFDNFDYKKLYKEIAGSKFAMLDSNISGYKKDVGIIQRLNSLHKKIKKLKYEEGK